MVKKKKAGTKARKSAPKKKAKRAKTGAVKKTSAKKARAKVRKTAEAMLEKIGEVTHYFPHVKAAAVTILKGSVKRGDELYIKGHTTDFKEKVKSIQLDHVTIEEGKAGQEIGLLVKSRVRIGDSVYKV